MRLPSVMKITKIEQHGNVLTVHFYVRKWHPIFWWYAMKVLARMFRQEFGL